MADPDPKRVRERFADAVTDTVRDVDPDAYADPDHVNVAFRVSDTDPDVITVIVRARLTRTA